jgi:hypothetical protein
MVASIMARLGVEDDGGVGDDDEDESLGLSPDFGCERLFPVLIASTRRVIVELPDVRAFEALPTRR